MPFSAIFYILKFALLNVQSKNEQGWQKCLKVLLKRKIVELFSL